MKKLKKDFSMIDNSLEAYTTCTTCITCSCTCTCNIGGSAATTVSGNTSRTNQTSRSVTAVSWQRTNY